MEKIKINNFEELIEFLSSPELNKSTVCEILAENYGIYVATSMSKKEIIKEFAFLWESYHLKGLEMPLFI